MPDTGNTPCPARTPLSASSVAGDVSIDVGITLGPVCAPSQTAAQAAGRPGRSGFRRWQAGQSAISSHRASPGPADRLYRDTFVTTSALGMTWVNRLQKPQRCSQNGTCRYRNRAERFSVDHRSRSDKGWAAFGRRFCADRNRHRNGIRRVKVDRKVVPSRTHLEFCIRNRQNIGMGDAMTNVSVVTGFPKTGSVVTANDSDRTTAFL